MNKEGHIKKEHNYKKKKIIIVAAIIIGVALFNVPIVSDTIALCRVGLAETAIGIDKVTVNGEETWQFLLNSANEGCEPDRVVVVEHDLWKATVRLEESGTGIVNYISKNLIGKIDIKLPHEVGENEWVVELQ